MQCTFISSFIKIIKNMLDKIQLNDFFPPQLQFTKYHLEEILLRLVTQIITVLWYIADPKMDRWH